MNKIGLIGGTGPEPPLSITRVLNMAYSRSWGATFSQTDHRESKCV